MAPSSPPTSHPSQSLHSSSVRTDTDAGHSITSQTFQDTSNPSFLSHHLIIVTKSCQVTLKSLIIVTISCQVTLKSNSAKMPPCLKSVTSLEQALPSHNFMQSATEAIKLFTKSYSTFFPAIKLSQYLSSGCFTPINLLLLTLILIKQRPRLLHHLSIRVPRFLVSDM